jgi:hypothetical protein
MVLANQKRTLQEYVQAKIPTETTEIRTTIETIRNIAAYISSIAIAMFRKHH